MAIVVKILPTTRFFFDDHFGGKGRFMLQVSGEGLAGMGIMDRDYVVVEPTRRATREALVIARIGREPVIRQCCEIGSMVGLKDLNSRDSLILVDPSRSIEIVGIVIGVIRVCEYSQL